MILQYFAPPGLDSLRRRRVNVLFTEKMHSKLKGRSELQHENGRSCQKTRHFENRIQTSEKALKGHFTYTGTTSAQVRLILYILRRRFLNLSFWKRIVISKFPILLKVNFQRKIRVKKRKLVAVYPLKVTPFSQHLLNSDA